LAVCQGTLHCQTQHLHLSSLVLTWSAVRPLPCRIRDLNDEINKLIREKVRQSGSITAQALIPSSPQLLCALVSASAALHTAAAGSSSSVAVALALLVVISATGSLVALVLLHCFGRTQRVSLHVRGTSEQLPLAAPCPSMSVRMFVLSLSLADLFTLPFLRCFV
jgi:hypothetical protein